VSRPRTSPATPATPLQLELAWLVKEGLASPMPGGEYVLTDDGLRYMVWAMYQHLGRPGMPAEVLDPEVRK